MKFQGKSKRIETGGRLIASRGKRKAELGRESADTHVAAESYKKSVAVRGGGEPKIKLLRANIANVTNPADGTTKVATIKTVKHNPANQHFTRRNLITKGAVIVTELGDARVTSRPGQCGVVNAVIV